MNDIKNKTKKTMLRLVVCGGRSDQWAVAEQVDVDVPAFWLGCQGEPHTAHYTHTRVYALINKYSLTLIKCKCVSHIPHRSRFFLNDNNNGQPRSRRGLQGCRASCTALVCRIGYTLPGAPGIPARGADDAHDTVAYLIAPGPLKSFLGGDVVHAHTRKQQRPLPREEDGVGPSICAHAVLFHCLIPLCSFCPYTPLHRAAPGGFVSQPGHWCLGI